VPCVRRLAAQVSLCWREWYHGSAHVVAMALWQGFTGALLYLHASIIRRTPHTVPSSICPTHQDKQVKPKKLQKQLISFENRVGRGGGSGEVHWIETTAGFFGVIFNTGTALEAATEDSRVPPLATSQTWESWHTQLPNNIKNSEQFQRVKNKWP